MMPDEYSFSVRRARIIHCAVILFLLMGLGNIVGMVASMVRPGLSLRCSAGGCADRTNLIDLAPDDARPALAASREAQLAFERHVGRPIIRAGLAGTQAIHGLPFAMLMFAVAVALKTLAARKGNDLALALPWLRWASIAALLMTVATPIADSLEAMILYPGTPSGPMWYFAVDFRRLAVDMSLALAAVAVVWALDSGSRAERDIASFV